MQLFDAASDSLCAFARMPVHAQRSTDAAATCTARVGTPSPFCTRPSSTHMVRMPVALASVVVIVVPVVGVGYLVRDHAVPDQHCQPRGGKRLEGNPRNLGHA
jgi:hypothetical protein